jgi:hypothetical protein
MLPSPLDHFLPVSGVAFFASAFGSAFAPPLVAFGAAFVSATGVVAGLAGALADADGVAGVAGAAAVAGLAGVAGAAAAGLFAGADGAVVVCATALPATNRPAISIVTILLMVFVLSLDDTDDLC